MKKYLFTESCLPSFPILNELEKKLIIVGLNKLVTHPWYDICSVDALAYVLQANIKGNSLYDFLRLAHCVPYKDMGEDFSVELIDKTLTLLRIDTTLTDLPIVIVEKEVVVEKEESPSSTPIKKPRTLLRFIKPLLSRE